VCAHRHKSQNFKNQGENSIISTPKISWLSLLSSYTRSELLFRIWIHLIICLFTDY